MSMFSSFVVALSLVVSVVLAADPLGPYKIKDVTVSGISSGGYMANQVHIAFSSIINGSAVFAAGPFYCAEGSVTLALTRCSQTSLDTPNAAALASLTLADEALAAIDPTGNLKDDRVYIFSGAYDTAVDPKVVKSLEQYYQYFVDPKNIISEYTLPAEHTWPTLSYGNDCLDLKAPYLGKCNFDAAGKSLQVLYGEGLNAPASAMVASNFMQFKQDPYIPRGIEASLGENGYIYVPTTCQSGAECRLHISFRGCLQYEENTGTTYPEHAGWNEWAENNNIIVLYPYTRASVVTPMNPNGCWDWWGYTGPLYGGHGGVQMQFVRNLITKIAGR